MSEEQAIKKSISLPMSILERALERAEAQHRSFSNYVQALIAKDLEQAKAAR